MEVHRHDADGTVVVRVTGELDTLTVATLEDRLAGQDDPATPATLVLDLSDLTFMSSGGLALLVTHHQRCAEQGGRLHVVTGNNRSVLRPVRVTGLDTMLHLFATVADATQPTR